MTVSRILTIGTAALSVLAAIGCSSPQPSPYVDTSPAPTYVQAAPLPEPVVTAEVMPAPAPAPTVVAVNNDPIVMASSTPIYTSSNSSPTVITERAPRADRN